MWVIPDEGVTKDITTSDAELRGHAKKLIFTKFHPVADYTLASASADNTVRLWDVASQKAVVTFDDFKSTITGLEWSQNGSLIASIAKDKVLSSFDPRKEGPAMTANAHEGSKP
jgi:WD40 repeat protein